MNYDPDDTLLDLHSPAKRVRVLVRSEYDEDPDTDWLGTYTSLHKADWREPLYSVRADAIRLAKSDLWRDRKGRIVAAPEDDAYARSYIFIQLPADCDKLAYGFSNADRLTGLNNQEWYYVGICAKVYVDNREIGDAACWGFESDMPHKDFRSEARNLAREAIHVAKDYLAHLQEAS